ILLAALRARLRRFKFAPGEFVEPATSGFGGQRSIQLSYGRKNLRLLFIPAALCAAARQDYGELSCSPPFGPACGGSNSLPANLSNLRPLASEASALSN
ncbi:MAG TPA: hypothetical protein VFK45_01610, partial [Gammaproteobacteria bacterium]|nr:hypothetical protein [Gammaproteobacteria bacterium]